MILLTKLDGSKFVLNSDLIETIEERPDTTVRLTTKSYYIVQEPMEEVIQYIIRYRRACNAEMQPQSSHMQN